MPVEIERISADGLTLDLKVTETPLALTLVIIYLEAVLASAEHKGDIFASLGIGEVQRVISALKIALKGAGFWMERDSQRPPSERRGLVPAT